MGRETEIRRTSVVGREGGRRQKGKSECDCLQVNTTPVCIRTSDQVHQPFLLEQALLQSLCHASKNANDARAVPLVALGRPALWIEFPSEVCEPAPYPFLGFLRYGNINIIS